MLLTLLALRAIAPVTRSIDIARGWEMCVARPDTSGPANLKWAKAPGDLSLFLSNTGVAAGIWYRKTFKVGSGAGEAVEAVFPQALYAPEVFLDGHLVDSWKNGWTPHAIDLTSPVCDGLAHTLIVHCSDRNSMTANGHVFTGSESDLRGQVLFPLGGYKDWTGIMRPPKLVIHPKSHLREDSLCVRTSVRKHEIELDGASVAAPDGAKVRVTVLDAKGNVCLTGAGLIQGDGSWHWKSPWLKPSLWAPEHPYLYKAVATLLRSGAPIHEVTLRFGFREIWTSGPDFYLNGIRRHFLASATWPVSETLEVPEIRRRIRNVKAMGAVAFRMHIGPWQSEFLDVADEEGLMLIDEAPVYTDGAGFYAYKDPRFWKNYRSVVDGMIRRDRNHPSLVMWSLGNEIRFMGNEQYDRDLPKKQGALAVFARSMDPTRPTTFEADIDPDGKFDVIGLHYPRELPDQHAYPAICDWLAARQQTDASGGMLGTVSTDFVWDRKKPLYIGEYLWVPQGDYSPGTVFFGEQAYENRSKFNGLARNDAWVDQTIAYRRAGVSGLCPWSPVAFGMASVDPTSGASVKFAYKTIAAYPRRKSLRTWSGQPLPVSFDVFNDSEQARNLLLRLTAPNCERKVRRLLIPGAHTVIDAVISPSHSGQLRYELFAGGRMVDSGQTVISVFPPTKPPHVLRWKSGMRLDGIDIARDVLLVPAGALDAEPNRSSAGMTVVGAGRFPALSFRRFLERGGRAVILAQRSLASTGLSVSLRAYASTMSFPASDGWSKLRDELSFWGADHYVATHQIARSGASGLRSLSVTGGPQSLAYSPMALLSVGRGAVVFCQYLSDAKARQDPAANHLLVHATEVVRSAEPSREGHVVVVRARPEIRRLFEQIGLDAIFSSDVPSHEDLKTASGLVIAGPSADGLTASFKAAFARGIPVLWIGPSAESFDASRNDLGASLLHAEPCRSVPFPIDREEGLLAGVTREEYALTTTPRGWDRMISTKDATCRVRIVPEASGVSLIRKDASAYMISGGVLAVGEADLQHRGGASFEIDVRAPGIYRVETEARTGTDAFGPAEVVVRVNDSQMGFQRVSAVRSKVTALVHLRSGHNTISIDYGNAPDYEEGHHLYIGPTAISGPLPYPASTKVAVLPGAFVHWQVGRSVVAVDTFQWYADSDNVRKAAIYAGALCANLGLPFRATSGVSESIPCSAFHMEGGPYNEVSAQEITLRSNGSASCKFFAARAGHYHVACVAASSSFHGAFSRIEIEVDGRLLGAFQCSQAQDQSYSAGDMSLTKGAHALRVRFVNDESDAKEDRNAFIHDVSVTPIDEESPDVN